jgi:hypothetical protein
VVTARDAPDMVSGLILLNVAAGAARPARLEPKAAPALHLRESDAAAGGRRTRRAGVTAPLTVLRGTGAGMNQRGLYKDSALLAVTAPIFWLIEWLLKQPGLARNLFDGFRSKPRVESILRTQVYRNESQVNDELVDILYQPSEDPDALGVFVEVRQEQVASRSAHR